MTARDRSEIRQMIQDELRKAESIEDRLKLYFHNRHDVSLFRALKDTIDDDKFDIIFCVYRDDMTIRQTAEELEMSERTVKRHKKRLLDEIKKKL